MNEVIGKVAFWLDHGDICLMTGDFQEHFTHKTWPRTRLDMGTWATLRNYVFLGFMPQLASGAEPVARSREIAQLKRRI